MNRKAMLNEAKNYILYYGHDHIEILKDYDIAIVEPLGQQIKGIEYLKSNHTLALGYFSLCEIHPNSPIFKLLGDEDFLKIGGKRVINSAFNTFLVDIRSPRWKNIVFHHLGNLFFHMHYDGVFLDTVDAAESPKVMKEFGIELILCAIDIIYRIKIQFPEFLIIQNNGFNHLLHHTKEYIDGILWENPLYDNINTPSIKENLINTLETIAINNALRIFILEEQYHLDTQKILNNKNWLYYLAPGNYTTLNAPSP